MFGLFNNKEKELNDDEKKCLGFIRSYIKNIINIMEKGYGSCVCYVTPYHVNDSGSADYDSIGINVVVHELYNESKKSRIVDYIEHRMNIFLNVPNTNKYIAMEKAFGCDLNWNFDDIDKWKDANVDEMETMSFDQSFLLYSSNKKTLLNEIVKSFENIDGINVGLEKSGYVSVYIDKR